jgi:hypothetical protein
MRSGRQAPGKPKSALAMSAQPNARGVLLADAFLHGTVHKAQEDLQAAAQLDQNLLALWQALTPLGRNKFICWADDAKQATTRQRRIARTRHELLQGKKRPCCWAGASTDPIRRLVDGSRLY